MKLAVTDAHTAVLLSGFYRAGDGNDASFKGVQVIVIDRGRDALGSRGVARRFPLPCLRATPSRTLLSRSK